MKSTRRLPRSLVSLFATLAILLGMGTAVVATSSPAVADATHQALIGMPFDGKWAYDANVYSPYNDDTSSHPSVHHHPGGGDWATDLYGLEGTAIKFKVNYATAGLSYSWASSSTSCGQSVRINVSVGGVQVGWIYFAHLNNAVTSGAITNGMTIGTVHNWGGCNPGTHVHVEFHNTTNYSCYAGYDHAGINLIQGDNLGVLGSTNTGGQQPCGSIPTPPSDTDGDGIADPSDSCPTKTGPTSSNGCPIPLRDFNGDGRSDIFWYGSGVDTDWAWYGSASAGQFDSNYNVPAGGSYTPFSGDFDGDGRYDIFWYAPGGGTSWVWYGTATKGVFDSNHSLTVSGTYTPLVGDFDGDGKSDVFWYGSGSNPDGLWYGTSSRGAFSPSSASVGGVYAPFTGDFNGDRKTDIFWYAAGSSGWVWYGMGTQGQFDSNYPKTVSGTYTPLVGDFDGDGKSDVFWYGSGSMGDSLWSGTSTKGVFSPASVSVSGTYTPFTGDFNGDGYYDIFWYGPGTDADSIWGGTSTQGAFGPSSASVAGTYTPVP